ncbi:MAG: hypothetical protein R3E66_24560 [bacterium]
MNENYNELLFGALARHKISAERVADSVNLVRGEGPTAHRVNVDLAAFQEVLPADEADVAIRRYADGIAAVMMEPGRSIASSWDFARTVARVTPRIVPSAFLDGARAALGGVPPFSVPFHGDLCLVVIVELDRGSRVLTRSQVDAWGATDDRVVAAARSLLFHRTRDARWAPRGDGPVYELSTIDDERAVCSTVFADVFYSELKPGARFGIPARDTLLFVLEDTSDNLEALKVEVDRAFRDAEFPLTGSLFGFESGIPIPVEH